MPETPFYDFHIGRKIKFRLALMVVQLKIAWRQLRNRKPQTTQKNRKQLVVQLKIAWRQGEKVA